jgi:hypothetical protein
MEPCHTHGSYHIVLVGGRYRIRDPQELLLTDTRSLEGLEGVDIKSTSVGTIRVCCRVGEQMYRSSSGSCRNGRALDSETHCVLAAYSSEMHTAVQLLVWARSI